MRVLLGANGRGTERRPCQPKRTFDARGEPENLHFSPHYRLASMKKSCQSLVIKTNRMQTKNNIENEPVINMKN